MKHSTARPEVKTKKTPAGSLDRAFLAARTAEENRGADIVILDMRELTSLVRFFRDRKRHQPAAIARHERRNRPSAGRRGRPAYWESKDTAKAAGYCWTTATWSCIYSSPKPAPTTHWNNFGAAPNAYPSNRGKQMPNSGLDKVAAE